MGKYGTNIQKRDMDYTGTFSKSAFGDMTESRCLIGICDNNNKVIVSPRYSLFLISNYDYEDDNDIQSDDSYNSDGINESEHIFSILTGRCIDSANAYSKILNGFMYLINPTNEIIEVCDCIYDDI
jgi:hypothetical protein